MGTVRLARLIGNLDLSASRLGHHLNYQRFGSEEFTRRGLQFRDPKGLQHLGAPTPPDESLGSALRHRLRSQPGGVLALLLAEPLKNRPPRAQEQVVRYRPLAELCGNLANRRDHQLGLVGCGLGRHEHLAEPVGRRRSLRAAVGRIGRAQLLAQQRAVC